MPQGIEQKERSAVWVDLGQLEYRRALELQMQVWQSKIDDPLLEDQLLFVEHLPVFTLGKRGGQENLGVSKDFLSLKQIDIVQTDRGGNITYHGPGQAVLYPIVNLEKNRIGVKDFVNGLEEIMKRTANDFNIDADRNTKNHGIWVGNSKIGSVGISIKKGISFHGIALNIDVDLEPFSWINPCGLTDISMTSFEKEIEKLEDGSNKGIPCPLSMEQIKISFIHHFSSIFNYSIL